MVVVLDDSKYKGLEIQSDGEGLESDGITYTITNNNAEEAKYKIVLTPNVHDSEVLDLVRVSIDDIYTYDLTKRFDDNIDIKTIGNDKAVILTDMTDEYNNSLINTLFKNTRNK